jgi:hypothetical protein
MRNAQRWSSTEEQSLSMAGRTRRRLIQRTLRMFYVQGDTPGRVWRRIAVFALGWAASLPCRPGWGTETRRFTARRGNPLGVRVVGAGSVLCTQLCGFSERVTHGLLIPTVA